MRFAIPSPGSLTDSALTTLSALGWRVPAGAHCTRTQGHNYGGGGGGGLTLCLWNEMGELMHFRFRRLSLCLCLCLSLSEFVSVSICPPPSLSLSFSLPLPVVYMSMHLSLHLHVCVCACVRVCVYSHVCLHPRINHLCRRLWQHMHLTIWYSSSK